MKKKKEFMKGELLWNFCYWLVADISSKEFKKNMKEQGFE